MNHVTQPRLCPACVAEAQSIADQGPSNDRVIKRCRCAGPDANVIAVCSKVNGRIMHWHVEGPMTEAQAEVTGAAIVATFMSKGMRVHDTPPKH